MDMVRETWHRDRQTDRQTETNRERDRGRDRQTDRERERDSVWKMPKFGTPAADRAYLQLALLQQTTPDNLIEVGHLNEEEGKRIRIWCSRQELNYGWLTYLAFRRPVSTRLPAVLRPRRLYGCCVSVHFCPFGARTFHIHWAMFFGRKRALVKVLASKEWRYNVCGDDIAKNDVRGF